MAESSKVKPTRINLLFGRFQPFTEGHYRCIKEVWERKGLPTLICMIDVPENKRDSRHPFSSKFLKELYEEWFKNDEKVIKILLLKRADPVLVHEQIGDDYEIASVTCGTDRYKDYQWMFKYKEQAKLSEDFEIIEIKRSDEDTSATRARQALLENHPRVFSRCLPKIKSIKKHKTQIFLILQREISRVI